MGLLQRAVETYDAYERLSDGIGAYRSEEREPFAPVAHIVTGAKICIVITVDGLFERAEKVDRKIIIPVTQQSAGRTRAIASHGLCEQVGYIVPGNEEKHTAYMEQLKKWCESPFVHPKAKAVLRYLERGTVKEDLAAAAVLDGEFDEVKNEKDLICWDIIGTETGDGRVWTDSSVMQSWIDFYLDQISKDGSSDYCYISGQCETAANQHLKGIVSSNGNAKIISANDDSNFTYRGRFEYPQEAESVGYLSSQKAHNTLKWLISNQGIPGGERTFVCWNPKGAAVPKINSPLLQKFGDEPKAYKPAVYGKEIAKKIEGYKVSLPDNEDVIIAGFDAATSGRLAVTYYNELKASDFLRRLEYWDETCCWYDNSWGTESPLLFDIIRVAFGTQRGNDEKARIEVDSKIVGSQMQRLLFSRIDKSLFPMDIMVAVRRKADNLQIYSVQNRRKILFTACAVVRKYHIDHLKEEWSMALEPERSDRSYQFGRLLAVMEKAERDTYDEVSSSRETNAIRMQPVFVQRPGYAAKIVLEKVKVAYYPRLKESSRLYYEKLIGEIMEQISGFPSEDYDKPLSETYLMGYYLQKNALYAKKTADVTEDTKTEEE